MNTVQIVSSILGTIGLFALGAWMFIKDCLDRKAKAIEAGDAMTEESGNWSRFKKILDICLFGFVTRAEREYGGGTGELKMSTVLLEVLKIMPDCLKGRIKLDVLKGFIEEALDKAKKAWDKKPELLRNTLESELLEGESLRFVATRDVAAGETVELMSVFAPAEEPDALPDGGAEPPVETAPQDESGASRAVSAEPQPPDGEGGATADPPKDESPAL